MKKRHILFILFCLPFFLGNVLIAQNIPKNLDINQISPSQIASVNIDDISDAQLQIFLERFNESGLTEKELEIALASKGMPRAQIQKLKARIAKLKSTSISSGSTGYDRVRTREELAFRQDDLFQSLTKDYEELVSQEEKEKLKKIFGYNLFNSELLTFEPSLNVPTPKNYVLGAGDEIIIDVWGASEQTYQEIISPDGYIKIPNLGPIYLNGLTIEDGSVRIKSRLTQIYSGLSSSGGRRPNTFVQVSIGQVRTIRVSVIGEAISPGTFNVSSLSTVGNVLYLSGGPNINGSLRNIELLRDGNVIDQFDGYDFLIKGQIVKNVRLQDRDIVRVLPYENRVEISGEIKRPGIYEMKEGETFEDLILFAGGFTENAYSGIVKIRRNNGITREFVDLTNKEFGLQSPQNGDYVMVGGIIDRFENRIQIRGAVFREGEYELTEELTLTQLIEKAQGLRGDAFLERGTIYRTKEDYSNEVISFNIRQILKGEEKDISLSREDVINIPSIYDLKEEFYLQVFGEVKSPGVYPFAEAISVEDLLLKAGGLRESASGSHVEVARRVKDVEQNGNRNSTAEIFTFSISETLALSAEASNFILQPFDQVYIRKSPGYQQQINIKVEGEVLYPGFYALEKKDERISDILKRTGGLTSEGFAKGATLIRRTEFNPPKSDDLIRLESLQQMKQNNETNQILQENYSLSETEALLFKRLNDIEQQLENYDLESDAEQGREGLNVKRNRLKELLEKDSTLIQEGLELVKYETIGIDLEKILGNPGSKFDLILNDGDIISIPKKLETVRLRGEFLYPITVRYDETNSFNDFVSQAGGFTENAKKGKTYVLYANGSVDRTRKFLFWNNYPKVERGAEIIAPEKPERRKMTTAEIVAISTSMASMALIISRILQ